MTREEIVNELRSGEYARVIRALAALAIPHEIVGFDSKGRPMHKPPRWDKSPQWAQWFDKSRERSMKRSWRERN